LIIIVTFIIASYVVMNGWDLRSRSSDFRLRISDLSNLGPLEPLGPLGPLGPLTSDLRPRTSDLRPQTSDLRPRISNLGPPISDLRPRISNLGPPISDLGPPTEALNFAGLRINGCFFRRARDPSAAWPLPALSLPPEPVLLLRPASYYPLPLSPYSPSLSLDPATPSASVPSSLLPSDPYQSTWRRGLPTPTRYESHICSDQASPYFDRLEYSISRSPIA
jgi:hypothetical protein